LSAPGGSGRRSASASARSLYQRCADPAYRRIRAACRPADCRVPQRACRGRSQAARLGQRRRLVAIDDLADITYRYDEPAQKIFFTVGDKLRASKKYDASGRSAGAIPARSDFGGVLNYNLFTATSGVFDPSANVFQGVSLTLDGRAFSPYGTLSQSAILRRSLDQPTEALRLDTTFAYSDQDTLTTYRAGDTITGGLAWTRPIRIGGLQVQRNFAVRPDLITLPLPSVAGTAAVPSTVDVYVNNMKTFSQDIGTGPYQIANLPVVTGAGVARVVLRDSSGHETVTSQPFYASPSLLAPGVWDFSVEAGLPRRSYGTAFDTYVADPVASASLRRGIFDWLTVESHAEGGARLVNGGAAGVMRLGTAGVVSAAGATSYQTGSNGFQTYVSYETLLLGMRINASSQRTFGHYEDLASVTAQYQPAGGISPQGILALFQRLRLLRSSAPAYGRIRIRPGSSIASPSACPFLLTANRAWARASSMSLAPRAPAPRSSARLGRAGCLSTPRSSRPRSPIMETREIPAFSPA
jgi:outer membrane usher protein FimD/PapC